MVGVKQFDADQTVERALEVFWKKGLTQTSMQDPAEATGVLRGSLYNAYGDKEALFLHAYGRYASRCLHRRGKSSTNRTPSAPFVTFSTS